MVALKTGGTISVTFLGGHPMNHHTLTTKQIAAYTQFLREEERAAATVMQIKDIAAGDYVFLCSDGVLYNITDQMLHEILSYKTTDAEKIALIAEKSKDSTDNNTAILIPIADVLYDDYLPDDIEYPLPENSGADTVKFIRTPEQACEVVSASEQGIGSKISDFFKKLF